MTRSNRARQQKEQKPPKRHHITPKVYLSAWADKRGQVHVIQPAAGKLYPASLNNVAVENDFYTLFLPDGTTSAAVEEAMARVEAAAATALGEARGGTWPLSFEHRYALGKLIALQVGRTPDVRALLDRMVHQATATSEAMTTATELAPDAATDETEQATESARHGTLPRDGPSATIDELLESRWTVPAANFDAAMELAKVATSMTWTLLEATAGEFLTSDKPVCFWSSPKVPGAVGMATADRTTFPISRRLCLEITLPSDDEAVLKMADRCHRRQISAEELVTINRRTADNASRAVILHVDQQVTDIKPDRGDSS